MECTQINQLQTFANSDSGAVSKPHVWPTWNTCSFLASYRLPAQLEVSNTSLLCGLCIWRWCFECERPVGPWDSLRHITWYAHKQNHQNWLEQFGHCTRGLKCIQLSFQTLSTQSKPLQALSFQSRQTCSTSFTVGQAPQVVRSHANMVG